MDGDTAVAKILKAEGVEWVAAYPFHSLIDPLAKEGIRPIIPRQERAGVNMADGYSRIMNGKKIGVFLAQRGPGAENAFGGVAQGFADSVPFLFLPGGHELNRVNVHPNFDSIDHYKGITKWAGNVNQVSRVPEMFRRAFHQMKNGRPGPVMLELPQDVMYADYPGELSYTPARTFKSQADADAVRDLVKALLGAKRPIINAGQGVLYGEATADLVEFAELMNLPVLTTLAGKSSFPEDHRLALGTGAHSATQMAAHFLKKADFIFGVGTSFTNSAFNAPTPKGVPLGQLTNCADDVNKDNPVEHAVIGDVKLVLRQLIEEARRQTGNKGRPDNAGAVEEIAKVKAEFMKEWGPRLISNEVPISPYRVFTEMAKAVDVANSIVTHDSGYPRDQLVPFWQTRRPHNYIGWGKSTQLGYGLGLALGAKLAAPNKTVINVMGDAAFGMAGLDIETAVRSNIGILTVVLNNGVMTHYRDHMPFATKSYESNKFGGNYSKVAEALGAHAERVETPDGLAPAFKRALEATKTGRPALVEAMTKEEENVPKFW